MKKFKKVARFVMELILTVAIISFILTHLISKTILNESYVLKEFNESEYYSKTYKLIESNFENYIQQSGLDEKILENIVTKEQVEKDTKKIIVSIYDGIKEDISTDEIKKNLQKNIEEQIDVSSLSKEQKKAIDEFIEKLCDEYKTTISNSNYEEQIHSAYKKVSNLLTKIKKIAIILIGVSIIIIILLNLRRNYKIFTNTATAMFASGIILTIINIYINAKIKVKYITILNEPISIVTRNIASSILGNILKYGIILIVLGLLMMIASNFIHNIVKYKSLMQDEPQEND